MKQILFWGGRGVLENSLEINEESKCIRQLCGLLHAHACTQVDTCSHKRTQTHAHTHTYTPVF